MADVLKLSLMRKNRSLDKEEEFSVSEGGTRRPKRLSSETLRGKLMDNDPESFSYDMAKSIIEQMGKGLDIKSARSFSQTVLGSIQGISVPSSSGKEKSTESQTGQALMEYVKSMIIQGGEALVVVVKTNFDLDFFCEEIRDRIRESEDQIQTLEASKVEIEAPDKSFMDLELKIDIEDNEHHLLTKYQEVFDKRMRKARKQTERARSARAAEAEGTEEQHDDSDNGGSRSVLPIDSWESSPEHDEFVQECAKFATAAQRLMEREYMKQTKEAIAARKRNQETTLETTGLKTEITRLQVTELMASELKIQCNCIVQKIKAAVSPYPVIESRLRQNVLVLGEAVDQPMQNDNLSGIFQNLFNEYSRVSISFVCNYLLSLLSLSVSLEEAESNPGALITSIAPMVKQYNDMNLSKHLTGDMLFVVALLKGLPANSKARTECLQTVLREVQARESDPGRPVRSEEYPGMPYYSVIVNHITEIMMRAKQFSSTTPKEHKEPKPKDNPKPSVLETAHAAEGSTRQGKPNHQYVTGTYRGEVLRSKQLYAKHHRGQTFPYAATRNPCENCTHDPPCYNFQCPKCNMYGHSGTVCRQHIPPSTKGGGVGHS